MSEIESVAGRPAVKIVLKVVTDKSIHALIVYSAQFSAPLDCDSVTMDKGSTRKNIGGKIDRMEDKRMSILR